MYQAYLLEETMFDSRKLLGEYSDIDNARARVKKELTKNADAKYVIEQTTGHVNSYGDLIATVVEEN